MQHSFNTAKTSTSLAEYQGHHATFTFDGNAFHHVSQADFETAVARASARVPHM